MAEDVLLRIKADVADAERKLGTLKESVGALSPDPSVQAQFKDLTDQIAGMRERAEALAEEEGNLREENDQLTESAGKGAAAWQKFAARLGGAAFAILAARDAFSALKDPEVINSLARTDEEAKAIAASFQFLEEFLSGRVFTALSNLGKVVGERQGDFYALKDAVNQSAEALAQIEANAERVGGVLEVLRKVREEREAQEQLIQNVSKSYLILIRQEEAAGGVTKQLKDEVAALVTEFGDKLDPALLQAANSLGILTAAQEKARKETTALLVAEKEHDDWLRSQGVETRKAAAVVVEELADGTKRLTNITGESAIEQEKLGDGTIRLSNAAAETSVQIERLADGTIKMTAEGYKGEAALLAEAAAARKLAEDAAAAAAEQERLLANSAALANSLATSSHGLAEATATALNAMQLLAESGRLTGQTAKDALFELEFLADGWRRAGMEVPLQLQRWIGRLEDLTGATKDQRTETEKLRDANADAFDEKRVLKFRDALGAVYEETKRVRSEFQKLVEKDIRAAFENALGPMFQYDVETGTYIPTLPHLPGAGGTVAGPPGTPQLPGRRPRTPPPAPPQPPTSSGDGPRASGESPTTSQIQDVPSGDCFPILGQAFNGTLHLGPAANTGVSMHEAAGAGTLFQGRVVFVSGIGGRGISSSSAGAAGGSQGSHTRDPRWGDFNYVGPARNRTPGSGGGGSTSGGFKRGPEAFSAAGYIYQGHLYVSDLKPYREPGAHLRPASMAPPVPQGLTPFHGPSASGASPSGTVIGGVGVDGGAAVAAFIGVSQGEREIVKTLRDGFNRLDRRLSDDFSLAERSGRIR